VARTIGDYAIIGDCRSAALVSRDGSIDWLCLPRFDSPSVFAAILDQKRGGCFRVAVQGDRTISRRYVGPSAVLETTFTTPTGVLRLTDAMPVADEKTKTKTLWPDHEVLRLAECLEGRVIVEVSCEPRMDYARASTVLRRGPYRTIHCEEGSANLTLRSEVPLTIDESGSRAHGVRELTAGDRATIGLTFADGLPTVLPADGDHARELLDDSVRWWEGWASHVTYDWKYRDQVLRSALTLKLLTYAPSGAMVAAPTTSLPEAIGGVRNWDYRYCWLRDASLTLCALVDLGCNGEGEAFLSWVLHATRLTQPNLQILYNVYGESRLPEHVLEHLEGFAGSRPVRVGNAATGQLQLDVYGDVVDAAYQYVERGGRLDRTTGKLLVGLGRAVCALWREPDEGIWEPRIGRRQNTHSKVMCWLALDRLIALRRGGHIATSLDGFAETRDAIGHEIETHAWNPRLRSYTAVFDSNVLDASLLRMAISGYADPKSERMRQTIDRVCEQLGRRELLYRYVTDDGLPPGEGTFVICSFWAVEALALSGRLDEAIDRFSLLVEHGNDVGLFSEEVDPDTGLLLGNFPQAFSHVGLINAAVTLADCAGESQTPAAAVGSKRKL
jgi:GH15 family glucan-1,4-alpha-glucosidase